MADNKLKATRALGGYTNTFDGTRVTEMDGIGIYSISVPLGGIDALNRQLESLCGLSFPETGRCVRAGDKALAGTKVTVALYGLQSDQCFLIIEAEGKTTCELFDLVYEALGEVAYLTNQSDSWAVLDVDGTLSLTALERLCMLDIAAFDTGSVARTVMEQLAVIIERPDTERLRMYSPRSSAESLLHAVTTSLQNVSGTTTVS